MRKIVSLIGGGLLVVALAMPAAAQDANVSVTHGIDGQDLGASQELPVDISINGSCDLEGVEFGDNLGPITVTGPTTLDIEIRLDDGGSCTGTLVVAKSVDVLFGQDVNIVAHLTSSGQPTLTAFNTNLSKTGGAYSRFSFVHGAFAQTVDVILARNNTVQRLEGISSGDQAVALLREGDWTLRIRQSTNKRVVFGPVTLTFAPQTNNTVIAVGSRNNGTLAPLVQIDETD